jgi:hypothetical protein
MTERPPDPLRPGAVPEAERSTGGRNAAVVLGVLLLAAMIVLVIWAIAR